jgi:hypothetical protein
MLKRLGTGKASSRPMVVTAPIIVYRAVEQDTGAMVQGLVFDTTATTEAYHQVQYGIT